MDRHYEKMKKLFYERDIIQKYYIDPIFIDQYLYKLYIVDFLGGKVYI